jgi:antitoxin (DNA-binding transcriptional repressor) of toxin-antitoxin stability system
MTIIGLKELSQNAGKIAERVAKGEQFTVVKRSKVVFEITAPSASNTTTKQDINDWSQQAINKYQVALKELHKN